MNNRAFLLLFLLSLTSIKSQSQLATKKDPPFLGYQQQWVDSVFRTLSVDEKIGQLMMPRGNYNANYDTTRFYQIVRDYHVGGFVLFAGSPVKQAQLVNRLQAMSKVPLMIGMDLEWGLAMRLDSTVRFPYQMTLGAMQGNNDLIEEMGLQIARQCRRLGVHVNYAPVVDVNNNPNNPVINFRSFGENREKVTEKALAYMKGLQKGGILTSIKHFPGHGDTDADSHSDLPLIGHVRQRLDSVELYPFRELIRQGATGVMIAHLNIPNLDDTKNLASTLSRKIVTNLLRKELGFKGLIFTDAMDMQGVTKFFPEGMANVKAILAGNDVLETFVDVPAAFNAIKKALARREITQAEIDARVRRILAAKAWVGLNAYQPTEIKNLIADLNPKTSEALNRKFAAETITLLRNPRNVLPLRRLDTLRIASLTIGNPAASPNQPTDFQRALSNYTQIEHYHLDDITPDSIVGRVREALKKYNLILVGVNGLSIRPVNNYGIKPKIKALVEEFTSPKTIVTLFSNAYTLSKFEHLDRAQALLTTYQETPYTQEAAAQLIFGAIEAKGKLPVTVNSQFKYNGGTNAPALARFQYGIPEEVGLNSRLLTTKIDSLVQQAITAKAIPGCQVLVAKEGKVIFQKSYGYHTYENRTLVNNQDVYDLASITKVSASLPALMRLADEGKFDVDKTLADYLPDLFRRSNKKDLTFRQILTHQSRLKAWIPFWKDALKKNGTTFKKSIFQADSSGRFSIRVADKLFLNRKYSKKMYRQIVKSPLNEKPGYVYSDLSFYLYPLIVEKLTGEDFETYIKKTFYQPLGAFSLTYNPYQRFPIARIVPTEYDSLFRNNLIHGRVHDEGAAMLNGLSGHAGLFGNANDLAKLMQMYLQKGSFGGQKFISETTLAEFERCQFCPDNRRALGFDRPAVPYAGNAARGASPQSFGHSGFTGTFTWVDPIHDLVYVFLSNRVYPTRNNAKLSELNTRTAIQQAVYEVMEQENAAVENGGR